MKMTTRVAYCNMRHYKSKNILIGIAIILTTLLLFVIPSIGKDMVEVNFAVIKRCGVHESGRCDGFHDVYGQNRDGTL